MVPEMVTEWGMVPSKASPFPSCAHCQVTPASQAEQENCGEMLGKSLTLVQACGFCVKNASSGAGSCRQRQGQHALHLTQTFPPLLLSALGQPEPLL